MKKMKSNVGKTFSCLLMVKEKTVYTSFTSLIWFSIFNTCDWSGLFKKQSKDKQRWKKGAEIGDTNSAWSQTLKFDHLNSCLCSSPWEFFFIYSKFSLLVSLGSWIMQANTRTREQTRNPIVECLKSWSYKALMRLVN